MRIYCGILGLVIALLAAACRESASPQEREMGSIAIRVQDPTLRFQRSTVTIDDTLAVAVAINSTSDLILDLPVGRHLVVLKSGGLCTAPNARRVVEVGHATVRADFVLACLATDGVVRIVTEYTNAHPAEPGIAFSISNSDAGGPVVVRNDTILSYFIPAGDHDVIVYPATLCRFPDGVSPHRHPFSIVPHFGVPDTVTVHETVDCERARAGFIRVSAGVNGVTDATAVNFVGDFGAAAVPINGFIQFPRDFGRYTGTLRDVPRNCRVVDGLTRTFDVHGLDTTRVHYDLECVASGTVEVEVAAESGANLAGMVITLDTISATVERAGTVRFTNVPVGQYRLSVSGFGPTCIARGQGSTVDVGPRTTVRQLLTVACAPFPEGRTAFDHADPTGDTTSVGGAGGQAALDITRFSGVYRSNTIELTLQLARPSPDITAVSAVVDLDLNRDGKPEYQIRVSKGLATVDAGNGKPLSIPMTVSGASVSLTLPFVAIGNWGDAIDVRASVGFGDRSTDAAPNAGAITTLPVRAP